MASQGPLIPFGPDANCTLALCGLELTVYKYRPSLPTNITFLVLFAVALAAHVALGFRWRQWWFMGFMAAGCVVEMIGYVGRIIMYYNPFSFAGFMIQIVFITSGPVFFTAAIYVTISRTIMALAPSLSRMPPRFYYYIFIAADLICLTLQAAGGALTTTSNATNDIGIDLAMAGLVMQVVVLGIFVLLFIDYLVRYARSGLTPPVSRKRMNVFFGFLALSVVLIFARCVYRCYELRKGYSDSDLITDEGLFIGLEGVLIIVSVFTLCVGNPGLIFNEKTGAGEKERRLGDNVPSRDSC